MLMIAHTGVSVANLLWNPGFPGIFAVCLSSGSVSVMELTEKEIKTLASLPGSIKANASKCKHTNISCTVECSLTYLESVICAPVLHFQIPYNHHLSQPLSFSNVLHAVCVMFLYKTPTLTCSFQWHENWAHAHHAKCV